MNISIPTYKNHQLIAFYNLTTPLRRSPQATTNPAMPKTAPSLAPWSFPKVVP
jgi:hypothetical protein